MRRVLAGLIDASTRMQCRVVQAVAAGDVVVLYANFQRTTVEASGKTVELNQEAIEGLRRQPDGTWLLIAGNPNGRGR
jgi:ketosteroid isomerase-like protein